MKKSEQELEKILSFFTDFPILETDERNKQIAFWINVYNGFTLLLVLQNYPLRSLRELEEGKIWQKKFNTKINTKIKYFYSSPTTKMAQLNISE